MSAGHWLALVCAVAAVAFATISLTLYLLARRERARRQALVAAHVKALAIVDVLAHTPVRGASRDRALSGKARRRARRQA